MGYVSPRRNLERVLPRFGVGSLGEDVLHDLNLAWHRPTPRREVHSPT